jgi:hypothetical protein
VCVCSLSCPAFIAHAPVILSSVACLAIPYFPPLSHKRPDFRGEKTVVEHKRCFDFFTALSGTFIIMRGIQRDLVEKCVWVLCKVLVIRVRL